VTPTREGSCRNINDKNLEARRSSTRTLCAGPVRARPSPRRCACPIWRDPLRHAVCGTTHERTVLSLEGGELAESLLADVPAALVVALLIVILSDRNNEVEGVTAGVIVERQNGGHVARQDVVEAVTLHVEGELKHAG